MKVQSFVIGVVTLVIADTTGSEASQIKPTTTARECPSGTPIPVDDDIVCNKTSVCGGEIATCKCSDDCLSYGDCCIDAPILKQFLNGYSDSEIAGNGPPSSDFQYEECQPIDRDANGYFMISRCPETFLDRDTRDLCENDPGPEDFFLLTPVSDVAKNRLFRNFYCAVCHETDLEDTHFWMFEVKCYQKIPNEDNSGNENDTSVSEDENEAINEGPSDSEDKTPVIDYGTSFSEGDSEAIDDGNSVSEGDNPVIYDGTSFSEGDNEAIDDGNSVSEGGNPVIYDGTSFSEGDNEAIDDGNSVSEGDNPVIYFGTSFSEGDNGAIDDGTLYIEDGNPITDYGTPFYEDENEAVEDRTPVTEDFVPTPHQDVLDVLSLMSNPGCKEKFNYRYNSLQNPHRSCVVIDVKDYVNDDGKQAPCPSYSAPYFTTSGVVYKNRVCASCNNLNVSRDVCNSSTVGQIGAQNVKSFSNLFLLRDGYKTSESGQIKPSVCTDSEIYDPYSNVCRPFVSYAKPKELTLEKPRNTFEVSGEFYLHEAACVPDQSEANVCQGIEYVIGPSFETLITSFLPNFQGPLENISTSCYPHKDLSLCKHESSSTSICTFQGLFKTESIKDTGELESYLNRTLLNETYRDHGCASQLAINIQEIFIATTTSNITCGNLTRSNKASGIAFTWNEKHNMTDVTFVSTTCSDEMNCPWSPTRFGKSEYVFDGSDVILKDMNRLLNKSHYRKLGDGAIAACVDLEDIRGDDKKLNRDERVQVILTVVGGSLSIVCLTATVLTYLIFPRLRNNVGKAILSLVFSLLIGQLFQLALWDKTENEVFCTFVAIVSHYSFLAAFFWMSVLGFDLSRTFGSRAKMQTVRDSSKVFFYYSLYGWFSPLLIVGACMVIHFGNYEKMNAANQSVFLLQYGNEYICWVVDQIALTYAFEVPIAVLLICNVLFLADTVFGIFSARAATRRVTQGNQQLLARDGKKDFLLLCKLSCIMGITWLFGFVAYFTDMQVFHIIFILLNSTQGIFIFLAFGCNPRVMEMWRLKYTKQKLTSTKSNSYSATAKTSVNSISGQQVNQIRVRRDQDKFHPVAV